MMKKWWVIYEYKVSCDSTPDCGFILVNVDKNDVVVPIASPTGNTPSELLDTGTGYEEYYYFSPFDIYAENMGWWNSATATRDQNLDAIFYSNSNAHVAQGYTIFNIQ